MGGIESAARAGRAKRVKQKTKRGSIFYFRSFGEETGMLGRLGMNIRHSQGSCCGEDFRAIAGEGLVSVCVIAVSFWCALWFVGVLE